MSAAARPSLDKSKCDAAEMRIPIASDLDIVRARQTGRTEASKLGFSSTDLTLIATAISELARNIVMYAKEGEIAVRLVRSSDRQGIIVTARDKGPGIADIRQTLQDGYSTSRSAVSVLECLPNISDARSFVASGHNDSLPVRRSDKPNSDLTLLGIHDDISGQLGNSRRDQRKIGRGEAELGGLGASRLPRPDNIQIGRYRDAHLGSVAFRLVQTRTGGGTHRLEILVTQLFSLHTSCSQRTVFSSSFSAL